MKALAVVVLYKQRIHQCKTIQSLLENHQTSPEAFDSFKLIIYDNSPDEQRIDLKLPFLHEYVHAHRNAGLAEAYNHAFREASAANFDWLLLLDQDSALPSTFVERLAVDVKRAAKDGTIAAFVPKVQFREHYFSPSKVLLGGALRPIDMRESGVYRGSVCAIGSCSLISVSFLRQTDGFNEFFWMDSLDRWLFQTIEDRGKKVYVTDSVIEHELSVLDYDRFMNPQRYLNIMRYETYFMMLYRSRTDSLIYLLRLLRRAAVFFVTPRTRAYSRLTLEHLKDILTGRTRQEMQNKGKDSYETCS